MTVKPRVLLSWSTGKDSAWALHVLLQRDEVEIVGLATTVIGEGERERVTMHGIGLPTLAVQAEAAGLPVTYIQIPDPCPNEDYERAMSAFLAEARADGITHMAFGDLFLEDVRRFREEKMAGTGIEPLFPLWGENTAELAREMIEGGLKARIVSIDTEAVGEEILGRDFDVDLLDDLPGGCDPCGEGGEFHTFTYGGPMFDRTLPIEMGKVRRTERFVHVEPYVMRPAGTT